MNEKKQKLKAKLILEDGTEFIGDAFGASKESFGEIVFNTGMTGYQEILSDPSYCGQIITMTYPLIGNYGINQEDFESLRPFVHGFVVREYCEQPSNWRSQRTLDDLLKEFGIPGISGIDTRKLTKIIRDHGSMKAIIVPGIIETSSKTEENTEGNASLFTKNRVFTPGIFNEAGDFEPGVDITRSKNLITSSSELNKLAKDKLRNELMTNQVEIVSTKSTFRCPGSGHRIVLVDYGYKQGILRALINYGCDVTVVPHNVSYKEIKQINPDGVLLSNGPGDPKDVEHALELIRSVQVNYPLFGICLGHQLFALANGANTSKMKFGHRGCNHPVKDLETNKVYISSQNHGYTVDDESLKDTELEASFVNVNDDSVEGLKHKRHNAFSVQFHPEAMPGPRDTGSLFEKFFDNIVRAKPKEEVLA